MFILFSCAFWTKHVLRSRVHLNCNRLCLHLNTIFQPSNVAPFPSFSMHLECTIQLGYTMYFCTLYHGHKCDSHNMDIFLNN